MPTLNRLAAAWHGFIESMPRITISIFWSRRPSGSNADYGPISLLPRHGNGAKQRATPPSAWYIMSNLSKLEQYMQLVDRLVQIADKEELAECTRLLAMNIAHYETIFGELTLLARWTHHPR